MPPDGARGARATVGAAGEADWRKLVADGIEAFRLTREYVGLELLPAIPGWSWFDWTERAADLLRGAAPLSPGEQIARNDRDLFEPRGAAPSATGTQNLTNNIGGLPGADAGDRERGYNHTGPCLYVCGTCGEARGARATVGAAADPTSEELMRLREFANWAAQLDDPSNPAHRTVTLIEIADRAQSATLARGAAPSATGTTPDCADPSCSLVAFVHAHHPRDVPGADAGDREPAEPWQALNDAMDFLDAAIDDTHPEGDGCDICRAADELRDAIEAMPPVRPAAPADTALREALRRCPWCGHPPMCHTGPESECVPAAPGSPE